MAHPAPRRETGRGRFSASRDLEQEHLEGCWGGTAIRVLVVDHEPAICRLLRGALAARGYLVSEANSGLEALDRINQFRPDVVLLELALPDMPGLDVVQVLREWFTRPILVLSARSEEDDIVAALDAGADDYLVKPFGLSELTARVRAALRRCQPEIEEPVVISGELRVDLACRRVLLSGRPVALTPIEYEILRALVHAGGKVLSHKQLMAEVWGHQRFDLHTLRVNVSNLRKKVELDPAHPQHVLTQAGLGYRFV